MRKGKASIILAVNKYVYDVCFVDSNQRRHKPLISANYIIFTSDEVYGTEYCKRSQVKCSEIMFPLEINFLATYKRNRRLT